MILTESGNFFYVRRYRADTIEGSMFMYRGQFWWYGALEQEFIRLILD